MAAALGRQLPARDRSLSQAPLTAIHEQSAEGGCPHFPRPSWRILARLSSTPDAPASFPLLTRKM